MSLLFGWGYPVAAYLHLPTYEQALFALAAENTPLVPQASIAIPNIRMYVPFAFHFSCILAAHIQKPH